MQPHGNSASIAMTISESATFVSVMAFLRPCTVYFKQVTHFGTSPHRKTFNQATSSSASVVRPCGLIKPASTVGSSAVNTVIGSSRPPTRFTGNGAGSENSPQALPAHLTVVPHSVDAAE
jgi:hypothetical protein